MRTSGSPGRAAWLLAFASGVATAAVSVEEVEQYYADPAVYTPAEPAAHGYATRFPSLSASGGALAYSRPAANEIVVLSVADGATTLQSAPDLFTSARDFSLSLDGAVLSFASAPLATGKASCSREINLRNLLTGSRSSSTGAACLSRPSKPYIPQLGQAFGFSSNIKPDGSPSPSNSYDLYFRRRPPAGKGTDPLECLTCAQDPGDSGVISVVNFSAEPVSAVAYRENKNLWLSPDGRRIAFVFSIAYNDCPPGDADCGESGVVFADVGDSGLQVLRSLRVPQRNRFHDLHGSSDGHRFVLSSSAALLAEDDDSGLDVYVYDLLRDRLQLLSAGLAGSANDPRISGNGRYAVFSSDSIARRIPTPTDVEVVGCTAVFDPVEVTQQTLLVDLQGSTPRRARVIEHTTQFGNSCNAASAALREGLDLDYTGRRLALTVSADIAAGDSNGFEDVYLVENRFARDAVFDHGFD